MIHLLARPLIWFLKVYWDIELCIWILPITTLKGSIGVSTIKTSTDASSEHVQFDLLSQPPSGSQADRDLDYNR